MVRSKRVHGKQVRHLPVFARRLTHHGSLLLAGAVIASLGLSACTEPRASHSASSPETKPAIESPAEPSQQPTESVNSPAPANEPSPPDANLSSQRATDQTLLIGPRAERNPPLKNCGDLATQTDMNFCSQENYTRVDAELNQLYQQVQNVLSEAGQRSLTEAETAWLTFRDLDCGFERDQFAGGSIAPLIYDDCRTNRTIARTDELAEPTLPQTDYAAADGQLNQSYQALTALLNSDRREALTAAQLAWIDYRDRHCGFESNYGASYGAAKISEIQCKARLSENRTRQLQAAIDQNSL